MFNWMQRHGPLATIMQVLTVTDGRCESQKGDKMQNSTGGKPSTETEQKILAWLDTLPDERVLSLLSYEDVLNEAIKMRKELVAIRESNKAALNVARTMRESLEALQRSREDQRKKETNNSRTDAVNNVKKSIGAPRFSFKHILLVFFSAIICLCLAFLLK